MKTLLLATSLIFALQSQVVQAEEDSLVVSVQRLTMETALKAAQAAIGACREMGIQVAVTVVDRNGLPQVTLRDTIAAQIAWGISKNKAFTAANFNAATKDLAERANTPVGRFGDNLMSTGGLPIEVGGALLGAIGVSGAPSGETDEACAQAGVDAIMADLEFL